jgi:hypothetical protein
MVQPREKSLVFKRLFHERVDLLLKGQLDTYADGAIAFRGIDGGCSLVGGLHETGAAARDDVATHLGQRGGNALDLFVDKRPRLGSRGAEYRHPIAFTFRRLQAREIVDYVPQAKDGADEDLLDRLLVRQADGARFVLLPVGGHRVLQVG